MKEKDERDEMGHSNNGYSLFSEEVLHMLVYILEIITERGERDGAFCAKRNATYTFIQRFERHTALIVTASALTVPHRHERKERR